MTKTFEKKSIWHSNLVRVAGDSGVTLKLLGDPRESKYPKPDISHYVYVQFPDDETEYSLSIENTTLDQFQAAPKKLWIVAHPTGSATEPAAIYFTESANEPVFTPRGDSREPLPDPTPQSGPPPMFPDGHPDTADSRPVAPSAPTSGPLGGDAVSRSIEATHRAIEGLKARGLALSSDAVQSIYSTHYIAESRR